MAKPTPEQLTRLADLAKLVGTSSTIDGIRVGLLAAIVLHLATDEQPAVRTSSMLCDHGVPLHTECPGCDAHFAAAPPAPDTHINGHPGQRDDCPQCKYDPIQELVDMLGGTDRALAVADLAWAEHNKAQADKDAGYAAGRSAGLAESRKVCQGRARRHESKRLACLENNNDLTGAALHNTKAQEARSCEDAIISEPGHCIARALLTSGDSVLE